MIGDESENQPPDWLVTWSNHWRCDPILSSEGDDWWTCEYELVTDESNSEVWIMVHQGVGGDYVTGFERIATNRDAPNTDEVRGYIADVLESIGDELCRGSFTITSPQWLPRNQMEEYLQSASIEQVDSLPLEDWLLREYGELGAGCPETEGVD